MTEHLQGKPQYLQTYKEKVQIDGLVQDCSISISKALEIRVLQSCIKPSK